MRKFIVVDGLDGTTCELNEKEIKDLAVYYYENSDDVEEVDFKTNPISDAIKYIERVDKVTEIE